MRNIHQAKKPKISRTEATEEMVQTAVDQILGPGLILAVYVPVDGVEPSYFTLSIPKSLSARQHEKLYRGMADRFDFPFLHRDDPPFRPADPPVIRHGDAPKDQVTL